MNHKLFIDRTEFTNIGHTIKLKQCRSCGMYGMLILHGFIYGYDEYRDARVIKARRLFCSNRNRRTGCGKTLSIRLVEFMCNTLLGTIFAWRFLQLVLSGISIEKAYGALDPECVLSLSTFFRFWKKFKAGQHNIRTFIADHYVLSAVLDRSPVFETIRHLNVHLADRYLNPISNYQKLSNSAFV